MENSFNPGEILVVVMAQPGLGDKQSTYKSMKQGTAKQLIGLGIVHIVNGILCIILQSIDLGISAGSLAFMEHGIWIGAMVSGYRPNDFVLEPRYNIYHSDTALYFCRFAF